ncbi:MAG: MerR family transcriptional regulator [Nitrospiraceae bacterium]|nr:MerR family transcriptional regulator [Nitrospiraceae bacterium]
MEKGRQYQIGELGGLLDMSPRTIRYYEEVGLLNSIKRIEGAKRVYTRQDLRRLRFIKRLKLLGLTLVEMKELEDIYRIHKTNKKVLPKLLELLERRIVEIDERVGSLKKLKTEILSYQGKIKDKLQEG